MDQPRSKSELSLKEAEKLIINLKAQGFLVESRKFTSTSRTTNQPVYHSTIDVWNVGKFTAKSSHSKSEAFKLSVAKLKQRLNSDPPVSAKKAKSDGDPKEPIPDADHLLLMHDFRKIMLLNQFLSAYQWYYSSLKVMRYITRADPAGFALAISAKPNSKTAQDYFTATVTVGRLFSCQAGAFDRKDAEDRALGLAHGRLVKFALLFAHFKSVYSIHKSPTTIVEQLISHNSEMIRLKVVQSGSWNASINILYLTELSVCEETEEQAKEGVYARVVRYLKALSSKVGSAPKLATLLELSEKEKKVVDNNKLQEEDQRLDQSKEVSPVNPLENTDPYLAARIRLINGFNSVYYSTQTSLDIINELASFSQIVIETSPTSDGTFISKVILKDVSVELFAFANTEAVATNKAATKAVEYLKNLAQIVADFKLVYKPTKPPVKLMEQLVAANRTAIKVNTSPNRSITTPQQQYLTVVMLHNVCSFGRSGATEVASKELALTDALHYLKLLSDGVAGKSDVIMSLLD